MAPKVLNSKILNCHNLKNTNLIWNLITAIEFKSELLKIIPNMSYRKMVRKKVTLKKDKNGVKSVFFLGNWAPNSFRLHVRIYSNKRCANFVFRQLFEKMAKKPLFLSKTPKKTSFSVINRKGSLNRKKIIRSFLRKRQFWRLKPKFLSCGSSCLVTIGKINLKN